MLSDKHTHDREGGGGEWGRIIIIVVSTCGLWRDEEAICGVIKKFQ